MNTDWRKEFDEKFKLPETNLEVIGGIFLLEEDRQEVIKFIESVESAALQRGREEMKASMLDAMPTKATGDAQLTLDETRNILYQVPINPTE